MKKNHVQMWLFSLLFSLSFSEAATAAEKAEPGKQICPRLRITPDAVELSDTEIRLICGDPNNPAWNNIPDNQATFHLKTFLQDRGYFFPKVQREGGSLVVDLGTPAIVKSFKVKGEPSDFPVAHLRKIIGRIITPSLLDEVKGRITQNLMSEGFACPDVKMEAAAATGELTAMLAAGPKQSIVSVTRDKIESLNDETPDRYRAFVIGQTYNADYLSVTTQRILQEGLVQSTYFITSCEKDGVHLHQKFVPGPPRVVRVGFGVNTETGPMVRAGWRNSRLGDGASIVDLNAKVSFRRQDLEATGKWYYVPYPSRYFIRPTFNVTREKVSAYENYTSKFQFAPGMTWDGPEVGIETYGGPTLNYEHTVVGAGPKQSTYVSFRGEIYLRSHYYEYYRNSPRNGFEVRLQTNHTFNNFLSDVDANSFRLRFEKNWNFFHYDPPLLVISVRGGIGTTITPETPKSKRLKTDFRHFLGGSTDLRGFGPLDLPGEGGALTSADFGTELRLVEVLPFGLQPLIFTDVGKLGERSWWLNSPVFWSPGGGIRWQSPIGVVRTTLARGFTTGEGFGNRKAQWQFYFSFGEEF